MRRILLLGLSFLLVACGTQTDLIQVWDDEAYEPAGEDRVLVIGLAAGEREQRLFEDAVVRQLRDRGVAAESSARLVPQDMEQDKETIRAALAEGGFTLVLLTRLIGVDKEQQYVPGSTYVYPSYYGGFSSYYYQSYDMVHTPGYMKEYEVVRLETNAYETKGENLVWGAVSATIDPASVNDAVDSVAKTIVSDLKGKGIVR